MQELTAIHWRRRIRPGNPIVTRCAARFYEPIEPTDDGLLRSTIFPGLWLDPSALLRGDLAAASAVVRRGLDSPEHAAFNGELQRARRETAG